MSGFGILDNNRPTIDDIADVLEAAAGTADLARVQSAVSDIKQDYAFADSSPLGLVIRRNASGSLVLGDGISSPLMIPNLEFWTDASDCATRADYKQAVNTGDLVTVLIDKSGNQRHATVATGTPTFNAGYRGRPGVTGKFATPGFITPAMGSNMTTFCVRQPAVGAGIRIALSAGANFWDGYDNNNTARSHYWNGITGTPGSGNSNTTAQSDGIGVVGISAAEVRSMMGGLGWSSSASNFYATIPATGGAVSFSSTPLTIGGLSSSDGFNLQAPISEVLVYSRYLTDSEIRQVYGYLVAKYESTPLTICVGNSLTSGVGSTSGATQSVTSAGNNYPSYLLQNMAGATRVITDAMRQITAETPRYSRLLGDGGRTIYVVWEGTNEISTYGSPANAYTQYAGYCRSLRAQNKRIIAVTTMYYGGSGNDARANAYVDQYNTQVRAHWRDFADGFADVAEDSRLQNPYDVTYFSSDFVHLKSVGYQVVAGIIGAAVTAAVA
jgi:lysophospholipase L1-like esterase